VLPADPVKADGSAGVTLVGMKQSVLTRYRVMAYVTATMLLVLCVFTVLDQGFGKAGNVALVVSQIHGVLYIVYVIFGFDLGSKAKWPFPKLAWVLLAGTIPFAAFFVERNVTREIGPRVAAGRQEQPVEV
jgi:integral membrane protein